MEFGSALKIGEEGELLAGDWCGVGPVFGAGSFCEAGLLCEAEFGGEFGSVGGFEFLGVEVGDMGWISVVGETTKSNSAKSSSI